MPAEFEPVYFDPVKPHKLRSYAPEYRQGGSPSIAYVHAGVGSGPGGLFDFGKFRRRIVACINACRGQSTEDLEDEELGGLKGVLCFEGWQEGYTRGFQDGEETAVFLLKQLKLAEAAEALDQELQRLALQARGETA